MSQYVTRVGEIILRDHYGDLVAKIGSFLVGDGWTGLPLISFRTKVPIGRVIIYCNIQLFR